MLKRTGVAHDQLISGNVGIGITNPLQKLHVSGNVDIDNGGILLQQGYGINTGISGYDIWMPTTTRVGIQTAGAERLSILNNGNVGIGATSPTAPLTFGKSVYGGTSSEDFFRIKFKDNGGIQNDVGIGQSDVNSLEFNKCPAGIFSFNDGTNGEVMRIHSNGNVGIGTTSPVAKFEVTDGSSSITLQEYSSGAAIFLDGVNGDFTGGDYFHILANSNSYLGLGGYGGGTTPLNISNDGKVGIGVTSPATRLYVKETGAANTAIFENSGQAYSFAAIKVAESQNNKAVLSFAVGDALASTHIFGEINGIVTNNGGALTGDLYFKTNQGDNMQERMRILANGKVGIGTTSPNGKLDVRQTANSGRTLVLGNTAASVAGDIDGQIVFTKHPAFYDSWKLYSKNINAGNGQADLYLDSYATTSTFKNNVTFLHNGNVGIGTTSPTEKLHIRNSSGTGSFIRFEDTGGSGVYIGGRSNKMELYAGGAERMRITSSGEVGIGTTSPAYSLHVETGGNTTVLSRTTSNAASAAFTTWNNNGSSGNNMQLKSYGQGVSGTNFGVNVSKTNMLWSSGDTLMAVGTIGATPLIFGTSNAERMRILSSGQLIVGGTAYGYSGTDLQVGNTSDGQNGLNILTSTTGYGYILFGDGLANASSYVGQIAYKHGDDYMMFQTNGSERMRINSSGNVGIGTTSDLDALLNVGSSSATNVKVSRIAGDTTTVYRYGSQADATLEWTCGSYFNSEVIITASQTNSGGYNNLYIRGIWSNNYTSHHWDELEHVGGLTGTTFTITNGQNGSSAESGRLTLAVNYSSGSFSTLNVRITDFYGSHSYTIT
jgi:hypothetical protein